MVVAGAGWEREQEQELHRVVCASWIRRASSASVGRYPGRVIVGDEWVQTSGKLPMAI